MVMEINTQEAMSQCGNCSKKEREKRKEMKTVLSR